jgi:dihydrofolate reductase
MMVTRDGFFAGPDGALDWPNVDEEFDEFTAKQLDELRIMVNPVVLGEGKHLFTGIHGKLRVKLLNTRSFRSGNVLLQYHVLRRIQSDTDQV